MKRLTQFVQERLEPASRPKDASSAAEIRQAFFDYCCGEVPKKEVGLRLARKGFAEETVHYKAGLKPTTKRMYRLRINDASQLVTLVAGSTGGSV
jgi:hypothetical protein